MKIVRIPKRNGKFRTIYVPDAKEKTAYRKLLPELLPIAFQLCDPNIVHGFMPGRSPITNAMAHVDRAYTLCFDLENFFDTVTWRHLAGVLPDHLVDAVLYDGAARQGLPTSPLVSNIAAAGMDKLISDILPPAVTYTRYADDLAFSYNTKEEIAPVISNIATIVEKCRFALNPAKTRTQWSGAGRRIITGVAIEGDTIYPTRRVKRKLRAAIHQGHRGSAAGLQEWIKQRPPAKYREQLQRDYESLRAVLARLKATDRPAPLDYGKEGRLIRLHDWS